MWDEKGVGGGVKSEEDGVIIRFYRMIERWWRQRGKEETRRGRERKREKREAVYK